MTCVGRALTIIPFYSHESVPDQAPFEPPQGYKEVMIRRLTTPIDTVQKATQWPHGIGFNFRRMLLDIMRAQMWNFFAFVILSSTAVSLYAQQSTAKPEDTEVWQPEPRVVMPGATCGAPPSDAIILFDGKNLDEWVSAQDRSAPAKWVVANSVVTVNKAILRPSAPSGTISSISNGEFPKTLPAGCSKSSVF